MDAPKARSSVHCRDAASAKEASPTLLGAHEVAIPPPGNTGGKNELAFWYAQDDSSTGNPGILIPTGNADLEYRHVPLSQDSTHPYAAITDYLNTTFKFNSDKDSLTNLFQQLFHLLGEKFAPAIERAAGKYNYKKSFQLGKSSGLLCIGGQAETVLVSLPGAACSLVQNWNAVISYFTTERNARITRWDAAVDDYAGVHSVDWAEQQYLAGSFQCGGNKPGCKNAGNWTDPDGTGRTLYVGNRKNGKLIRIYEKGQQLGSRWHPWVRWEVELHNTDRVIPWDVLASPGRYFVGSYPKVLSWVQSEMSAIRTLQKKQKINYDYLVGHLKTAWGPMLNVMCHVEGDADAVFKKLVRPGVPRRLADPHYDATLPNEDRTNEQS